MGPIPKFPYALCSVFLLTLLHSELVVVQKLESNFSWKQSHKLRVLLCSILYLVSMISQALSHINVGFRLSVAHVLSFWFSSPPPWSNLPLGLLTYTLSYNNPFCASCQFEFPKVLLSSFSLCSLKPISRPKSNFPPP